MLECQQKTNDALFDLVMYMRKEQEAQSTQLRELPKMTITR